MENKKPVLITIIVLLLLNTSLAIIGLLFKDDRHPLEENPNHEFYYKGYLWFYDESNELMSKYECLTEICDLTTPIVDDDTYGIKYYKEGDKPKISLINNHYTFITDGAFSYLFDITTGSIIQNYKAVKTYNTFIAGDYYIVKNDEDLWGVLMINDMLATVIPFEYDFIGLPSVAHSDNTLKSDKFIVFKDQKWYVINNENSAISGSIDDPIAFVTDDYIISQNNERVRFFSYDNHEYLTNFVINDYIIKDNYIGIITNNFLLIYKNLGDSFLKSVVINSENDKVDLEVTSDTLNVIINDNIVETIAIS